MYVIKRKSICLALMLLLFGTFAFSYEKEKLGKKQEIQSTASTPTSSKVVVIDAGHGVPDERSCLLTLKITLIFYKK